MFFKINFRLNVTNLNENLDKKYINMFIMDHYQFSVYTLINWSNKKKKN